MDNFTSQELVVIYHALRLFAEWADVNGLHDSVDIAEALADEAALELEWRGDSL